jgi:hypothetical protein
MITLFIILIIGILTCAPLVDFNFNLQLLIPESPSDGVTNQDVFVWNYPTILNILLIPAGITFSFIGKE